MVTFFASWDGMASCFQGNALSNLEF